MATSHYRSIAFGFVLFLPGFCLAAPGAEFANPKEGIVGTYRKSVPEEDFATVKTRDEKDKARVMERVDRDAEISSFRVVLNTEQLLC